MIKQLAIWYPHYEDTRNDDIVGSYHKEIVSLFNASILVDRPEPVALSACFIHRLQVQPETWDSIYQVYKQMPVSECVTLNNIAIWILLHWVDDQQERAEVQHSCNDQQASGSDQGKDKRYTHRVAPKSLSKLLLEFLQQCLLANGHIGLTGNDPAKFENIPQIVVDWLRKVNPYLLSVITVCCSHLNVQYTHVYA
jgi:hypothetical protein